MQKFLDSFHSVDTVAELEGKAAGGYGLTCVTAFLHTCSHVKLQPK